MIKNRICKITYCCICGEQVKYISRHLKLHHPDILAEGKPPKKFGIEMN